MHGKLKRFDLVAYMNILEGGDENEDGSELESMKMKMSMTMKVSGRTSWKREQLMSR